MTAPRALDHASRPADYPAWARAAKSAGYAIDLRYLCRVGGHDPERDALNARKVARPAEVTAAIDAGLQVGLVWQDTKHDAAGGRPAGRTNGAEARRQAAALGAPPGTRIWFAVADYDAPRSDWPLLAAYLEGIHETVGPYEVGGYGKRETLEEMLRRRLVVAFWQPGRAWAGGKVSPNAAMVQGDQITVGGIACDPNEVRAPHVGTFGNMRIPQALIDAYRREGLDVPEYPGWRTRGVELAGLLGLVWHHTATGSSVSDQALRDLCAIKGNPTTPPPLAQFVGERDGQLPVLASGKCNHNGYGTWGNSALALELANNGVGEPFPDVQVDRALRWSAVTCLFYGWHPDTHMRAHKETDPTRKVDPAGMNMNAMRAAVALHMLRIAGVVAPPAPTVPTGYTITRRGLRLDSLTEDLMRIRLDTTLDDQGRGWLPLDGQGGRPNVPFGDLISVRPLGSNPGREGYWPIPETAEQDQGGKTLLTVEGGAPKGACTLFLVVPDAA